MNTMAGHQTDAMLTSRDMLCVFIGIALAGLWDPVSEFVSPHVGNAAMHDQCEQIKQVVPVKHQQIHVANVTLCTINTAPLLHVIATADKSDAVAITLRVRLLSSEPRLYSSSCGQLVSTHWAIYTLANGNYHLKIREEYRSKHSALADLTDVPSGAGAIPPFMGRVLPESPISVSFQSSKAFACADTLYSHVYMFGDSSTRHLFQHLSPIDAANVTYFQPPRHQPLQFPQQQGVLRHFLAAHPNPPQDSALLFDFAGLWNVAYGTMEAYDHGFEAALASVRQHTDRWKLFWTSTVAVHPIHFAAAILSGDPKGRSKWQMTAPRVMAMNAIARKHIARHNLRFPAQRVRIVDLWPLTRAREHDPATPTDMRHYGHDTYQQALRLITERMCGAEFLD